MWIVESSRSSLTHMSYSKKEKSYVHCLPIYTSLGCANFSKNERYGFHEKRLAKVLPGFRISRINDISQYDLTHPNTFFRATGTGRMEREVGGRISGHFVSVKQWNLLHTDSISQLVVLSLHFGG